MEASTVGLIVYLGATVLLMIAISIYAYTISEWKSTTSLKAVASMKSIYRAVLVNLYDTSTDVAVLISCVLASKEVSGLEDYENVNMLSLFIPSILVIFTYRIAFILQWGKVVNISQSLETMKKQPHAISKTQQ